MTTLQAWLAAVRQQRVRHRPPRRRQACGAAERGGERQEARQEAAASEVTVDGGMKALGGYAEAVAAAGVEAAVTMARTVADGTVPCSVYRRAVSMAEACPIPKTLLCAQDELAIGAAGGAAGAVQGHGGRLVRPLLHAEAGCRRRCAANSAVSMAADYIAAVLPCFANRATCICVAGTRH